MNNILYEIFEQVKNKKARGDSIIELNIGEPDQMPPSKFLRMAGQFVKQGNIKYGSAVGEIDLKQTIAERHAVEIGNVIIGPGSKFLIFACLKTLLTRKDDEVIVPVPSWGTYTAMINNIGFGKIRYLVNSLKENWQIDLNKLHSLINKKTKVLIICDPSNPTSTKLKKEIKHEIIRIADKNKVKIILDNAYEGLIFAKHKQEKFKKIDNFIQIFSFSKTFAMTGFRLGYAIADQKIINEIAKFNQITITCVPPFIQQAGLIALSQESNFTKNLVRIYQQRAILAEKVLKQAGIEFIKPAAGLYIFAKISGINAEQFCLKLLNKGVAIVPGTAFGPFPEFIRISLTAPEEKLIRGLNIMVNEYKRGTI